MPAETLVKRCAVAILLAACTACAGFRFERDPQAGTVTILDAGKPVLTYRYGDQLARGAPADRTRSSYVHPIYGLDGTVLTEDFPADHLHHRGLSLMWPVMRVGDERCELWHIHGIRSRFDRFLQMHADAAGATLRVHNEWTMTDGRRVAGETWTLRVHPVVGSGTAAARAIDVRLELRARTVPITLHGEPRKGYGGLNLRLQHQRRRRESAITTDRGHLPRDSDHARFSWADLSAVYEGSEQRSGIAIFVPRGHPGFPPPWTLRYYGDLNVAWPGGEDYVLRPRAPLVLEYRIYVHRGDADAASLAAAYDAYRALATRSSR